MHLKVLFLLYSDILKITAFWISSWNDVQSYEAATKTPEEFLLGAETKKAELLLRNILAPAQ